MFIKPDGSSFVSSCFKPPSAPWSDYGKTWTEVAQNIPDDLLHQAEQACLSELVATDIPPGRPGALRRTNSVGEVVNPRLIRPQNGTVKRRHPQVQAHNVDIDQLEAIVLDYFKVRYSVTHAEDKVSPRSLEVAAQAEHSLPALSGTGLPAPSRKAFYLENTVANPDCSTTAINRYCRSEQNLIQREKEELIISRVTGLDCRGNGVPALVDTCASTAQFHPNAARHFTDGVFKFGADVKLGGVVVDAHQIVRYGATFSSVAVMVHREGEPPQIRMWIDDRTNKSVMDQTLGASLVFENATFLLPACSINEMDPQNDVAHITTSPNTEVSNEDDGVSQREYYAYLRMAAGDMQYCRLLQHAD